MICILPDSTLARESMDFLCNNCTIFFKCEMPGIENVMIDILEIAPVTFRFRNGCSVSTPGTGGMMRMFRNKITPVTPNSIWLSCGHRIRARALPA